MTITDTMATAITGMRELNAWHLTTMADCAPPDSVESPGAALLLSVRDNTLEAVGSALEDGDTPESIRFGDDIHEIADNAPSVYSYTLFQQFADLGAWQEDISEWDGLTDMEQGARQALYQIAERLVYSIVNELQDAYNADELSADEDE